MNKETLHLTLHKKWFDEILSREKKFEYRDIKPYWTKRLFDEQGKPIRYKKIIFSNGYSKGCRKMIVEFLGVSIIDNKYTIKLGKIIEAMNF